MVPLIILVAVFVLVFLINSHLLSGRFSMSCLGRFSLAAMLVVAGIAHFTTAEPMVQMMPEDIPAKYGLVYFTGICELFAAVGLLFDRTSKITGILLIVFFVAILPANIDGSLRSVPFGGMEDGPPYLFFRIPLQILFIVWTWVFAVISVGRNGEDF